MASQVQRQHASADPELDRSAQLAADLPIETPPRADEVDGAAVPLEVTDWYPGWRIRELREKYAAPDAYEPDEVDDDEYCS